MTLVHKKGILLYNTKGILKIIVNYTETKFLYRIFMKKLNALLLILREFWRYRENDGVEVFRSTVKLWSS